MAVASVPTPKAKPVAVEYIVPLPIARPTEVAVAAAPASKPPKQTIVASLGSKLFETRGYWRGAVQAGPDLPAAVAANTAYQTASIAPNTTGSTTLAYAAESVPLAPARVRPMGSSVEARLPQPKEATVIPAQGNTTIVAKPSQAGEPSGHSPHGNSPWLRAAIVTPSVSGYMTATRFGAVDMRPLQGLLHNPSISVVMTFAADPQPGLQPGRFNGPAVVFVATTTFEMQSTAAVSPPQATASLR